MCRDNNWPTLRLDGSTNANKRTKLVAQFNDRCSNSFAFLLSSKAGGCGINLIGGSRLVMFDPDWNPGDSMVLTLGVVLCVCAVCMTAIT